MEYKAVRVLASFEKKEHIAERVTEVLDDWAKAGWSLHSQSMISHVRIGPYGGGSSHEIVLLIFQRGS